MKPKAVILILLVLIAVALAVMTLKPMRGPMTAHLGTMPHNFELIDQAGNRISLSDMKGSVVFINFWATWCSSCIDELPSIERMFRSFSGNPSLRVVTILYKDDLNRALNFMKQNGLTFPVYLNPDQSATRIFAITGIPETFIIDKNGLLRNKVIGPAEWDSPRALGIFQSLLNEQ